MDNQHRKIKGYRELTQGDIDLMNRIKEKGAELSALHDELSKKLGRDRIELEEAIDHVLDADVKAVAIAERDRFLAAEPHRWASIGKTDIQTGIMALVRAVAQPSEC